MSQLIFDMSVSLDGFTNGADPSPDQPMGADGLRLHEWAFGGDDADRAVLDKAWPDGGAMICGRNTYDVSVAAWGADGPSADKRLPLVVITQSEPGEVPANSVYSFATGGIEAALKEARDRADGGDVAIMGGPGVGSPSHPVLTGHSFRPRRSACRESRRRVWMERGRMSSARSSEP